MAKNKDKPAMEQSPDYFLVTRRLADLIAQKKRPSKQNIEFLYD